MFKKPFFLSCLLLAFAVFLVTGGGGYVPPIKNVSAQTTATLVITPSSISVPTNGFYSFKAIYDSDGSGSVASQDVTGQSTWVSSNPGYVNPHPNVKGLFVTQHCIGDNQDITVYAFYNGLSGQASARSTCSPVSGSLGTGTITIQARFGVYEPLGHYLVSPRDLTNEEKNQISLKFLKRGDYYPFFYSIVESGVHPGTPVSVDVYSTDYTISIESVPAGWQPMKPYSCQPVVGQNTTCQMEFFKDRLDAEATARYAVDLTEGPEATLPSFSSGLVSAQFKKNVLESPSGTIVDMKMINFSGKQLLLVAVRYPGQTVDGSRVSGTVSVFVYDASNPDSPALLQENKIGNYVDLGKIVALDNYPYVFLSGLARQPNPNYGGRDYWTYVGKIDSSGKLTQTSLTRFAKDYQESQAGVNDNSPRALFALGGKTYLVTTDYGTLKFFDVTNSTDHTDSKMVSQYNSAGVRLALQAGYWGDLIEIVNSGNKTYVVTNSVSIDSGWFHANAVDFMFVIDVSNINNPIPVFPAKRVSSMFNHDWQLNAMEKKYLNRDSPNSATLFDDASSKVFHYYHPNEELSYNSANIYQTKDEGDVIQRIRIRNVVAGYSVIGGSNFLQEIIGSRHVVCEQRGGSGGSSRYNGNCGAGVRSDSTAPGTGLLDNGFPYKSIDFGVPLDIKNGVVISSAGKVSLLTSSGILFADTSSQFISGEIASSYSAPRYDPSMKMTVGGKEYPVDFFKKGILYQKDNKNFYAFVSTGKNVGVVKLSFSQGITPSSGGGSYTPRESTPETTARDAEDTSRSSVLDFVNRLLRRGLRTRTR